ncbi:MAG: DUF2946 family protein [Beijerinckiaceae bacterium]
MQKPACLRHGLERRAIVALACYFVIMQAFLAGLALGFSTGRAVAGDGLALICHGTGQSTDAASDPSDRAPSKPSICSLCAVVAGGALVPATLDVAAGMPVFGHVVVQQTDWRQPASFRPRAGQSRAPPILS